MIVSKFKGYTSNNPQDISLDEIVNIIRSDESVRANTLKHRYFLAMNLKADADKEKEVAGTFSVAARFKGGRKLKHLVELTGLGFGDFDKMEPDKMQELFLQLKEDPHSALVFTTHSGRGLRIVFRYQVEGDFEALELKKQAECYTAVFHKGMDYFEKLVGLPSDRKCCDCTRVSNIVHDPEVFYRPEAEPFVFSLDELLAPSKKPAKPRRVTLKLAVQAAQEELKEQGFAFEEGHHNDYVSRMGYLLNAYGVDFNEALEWVEQEYGEKYHDNLPAIMKSCYKDTMEHGTRKLPKNRSVAKWANIKQIESFLASEVTLRYNVVRMQVEICWNDQPGKFVPLTDRDEYTLWCRIKKKDIHVSFSELRNVIHSEFSTDFHPFKAYFDTLPPWDGIDHIGKLAHTVHVAGDQEQFVRLFRKWFVSIVPTLFDEQVVNHEIMVFIGRQGNFKSTFFSLLLPPELQEYFYAKTNNGVLSKDDILTMSEYGLICLDEIDGLRSNQLDQLKAMVTTKHTNERAAYARNKVRRTHIASFCGTGNNKHFLADRTGNRRWIAAEVLEIDNPHLYPFDYVGIYSQAFALWKEGSFQYWLDNRDIQELNERNCEFEASDMETELVLKYFRPTFPGSQGTFLTISEILERINGGVRQILSPIQLGIAMRKLGFRSHRTKSVRGYLVIERSLDEINASNAILAKEALFDV